MKNQIIQTLEDKWDKISRIIVSLIDADADSSFIEGTPLIQIHVTWKSRKPPCDYSTMLSIDDTYKFDFLPSHSGFELIFEFENFTNLKYLIDTFSSHFSKCDVCKMCYNIH